MTSIDATRAALRPDAQMVVSMIRDAGGRIDYALARKVFRDRIAKGHTVIFGLVAALAASRASAAATELTEETALDFASLPMIDSFEEIGIFGGDCVTQEAIDAAIAHIHDTAHEAVFGHHALNPLNADPFADPFTDPYRNVHSDHDDHDASAAHNHSASHGAGHELSDQTHHAVAHAGHQGGHHHAGHHEGGANSHGAHEISASAKAAEHAGHESHGAHDGHADLGDGAQGAGGHALHADHGDHMTHAPQGVSNHTVHMGPEHLAPNEFGTAELSAVTQMGDGQPGAADETSGAASTLEALETGLAQDAETAYGVADQHVHHHSHSAHAIAVAEEVTMFELETIDALPQVDGPIFA